MNPEGDAQGLGVGRQPAQDALSGDFTARGSEASGRTRMCALGFSAERDA